ncbi:MAG: UDP-N-acetyl-D-glucosamine 2-epimerase, UDP-hydrolysing [Candidatus Taylorbacteria bacterium RIFCSPHIGHO2_02_FULL_43_55]|nr:MAG: UDP-N-acetyl-D-glucosamine 2-epimerase, UDP-hydrolysing [Candidatus Taylorbacteria bacterium RIFCSPHIGHO2_02_FULL_43_55]
MSKKQKKRKICFVITSGIHYSRSKLILFELKKRKNVDLQIVVAASAILSMYSDVLALMKKDGFKCNAKITMVLEGGSPVAMAKTTGIGITEFTTVFENLSPDIVVVRGDRYEVLAPVIAAAYLNITIAHIEGGDVTGNIDESVRHAITKLSHIHFTTNEESKKRVMRMGELPGFVYDVGAPELEFVAKNNYRVSNEFINYLGVGDAVDINRPYIVVMQHPVTSEHGKNKDHIEETLHAIYDLKIPSIWFWPNVDAGTDEVSKGIRSFREEKNPSHMRFIKHIPPEEFIGLLKKTACLVGNSSSGIKECSYLGIPAVNIGSRQNGRMRASNVIDVGYDMKKIKKAIKVQIKHGVYQPSHMYYKKNTCKKICDILVSVDTYTQKFFYDGN